MSDYDAPVDNDNFGTFDQYLELCIAFTIACSCSRLKDFYYHIDHHVRFLQMNCLVQFRFNFFLYGVDDDSMSGFSPPETNETYKKTVRPSYLTDYVL